MTARPAALAALGALGALSLLGAAAGAAEQVIVTGSLREAALRDAPYAISAISEDTLRSAGAMVNLSEALVRVPGLTVANRNNYAQDLQISARGFGARAGFGVRGVRLYADGIPATMPDGQGQVAHFDLAGAARVEVLRGPFSALYGNSSGGVIALISAPAREGRAELALDGGSFGLRQARLSIAAPLDEAARAGNVGSDVRASGTRLDIDGFRPQSAAQRTLGQVRINLGSERDRITLTLSDHEQIAADPLGLTRALLDADARQTTPQATQFDTRKTVSQVQAGLRWRHLFDDAGVLRESSLVLYDGSRDVAQWLAIAPATQANVRHGGGVIDFSRGFGGAEARLRFGFGTAELATGVVLERQRDERKGYENFIGSGATQVLGVTGRLRRDELNRAETREAFAQLTVDVGSAWQLTGGVRGGRVRMQAEDRFLSNGDDSGRLEFSYTNPVLGMRWRAAPSLTLHASVARGFDSPTLGELAYRADNVGGFNTALSGQSSRQGELGAKWRQTFGGAVLEADAAVFQIETRDEIGVLSNTGGRASFQNVGRTERQGGEFASALQFSGGWRAALSLSVLQARYRDGFTTCTTIPCAAANVAVPPGNRVAGTSRGSAWGELATPKSSFGQFAIEWRGVAALVANDSNSEAAPGYGLINLRWSHSLLLTASASLELLARLDNAADRAHAGSVIVNDANGRFYEPGAPRNALVSARFVQRW